MRAAGEAENLGSGVVGGATASARDAVGAGREVDAEAKIDETNGVAGSVEEDVVELWGGGREERECVLCADEAILGGGGG